MSVLIGFERSGRLRRALRLRGVDAWSCDLEPAEDGDCHHIVGDVFEIAAQRCWRGGVFFPVCTYMTGAAEWAFGDGPYHQKVKPGTLVGAERRAARAAALDGVRWLMALPYPKAMENPVGAISKAIRKPDQYVHPYEFGDDASKKTCLWLDRLPPLRLDPRKMVAPRIVNGRPRWSNQTDSGQNRLSPSDDRTRQRSETYPGIAEAMAKAWAPQFLRASEIGSADAGAGGVSRQSFHPRSPCA